ncbi:hypothetical protein BT93_L3930 [Corymbia citriodora subsp. variegata]|uniref:Uncharacterized protein n=1 Tax=Corymbia citriodora subsp. variegata TaxID=360336 RepID=A0A8T0CLJ0_CORYI|nr:hypothetical protein BT93_L3930 [Corymbia citriodora subsp. variegata]
MLLDDLLVAENSLFQSDSDSPMLTSERASPITSPKINATGVAPATSLTSDSAVDNSSGGMGSSMDKNSMEKLREASAAEAEAANAVWQAFQLASSVPAEETSISDENSQATETASDGSDAKGDVHLHPRAMVVAKEGC